MWIENILKDTGDRMLENELRGNILNSFIILL